jgi:hypothetical protein
VDQDRHGRFGPAIDAMSYYSVWFYRNELRRWTGRAAAVTAREPLSTGRIEVASRGTRIASVCGLSAVGN